MQMQEGANESPHQRSARTLQGLFSLAIETEREVARNLNLNLTDYRAINVLTESGPVTVGALAADLGATAATTTAIVSRLESHGFVERLRSTEDRRQVHVAVTELAAREIAQLMQPLVNAACNNLATLHPDHQAVVADFHDVVLNLMQNHLQTLTGKDAS